ncbi:MAG TPA: hypothetical protein VGV59_19590 [Pyrinomonadaceae bacterium]|nr:hypothetical protein [Pyrinomonadaceae bacterium]
MLTVFSYRTGASRYKTVAALLFIVLTASALAVASRWWQGESAEAPVGDYLQVARFAVYDAGILPRETRVRHGRVRLILTDRTGGTTGLLVERENESEPREMVGRVTRAGGHWRGEQELHLRPGRYRVYQAESPEKQARIIVEP